MKEYLVPIQFETTVTIQTTVKISAQSPEDAEALIQKEITQWKTRDLMKIIDNKDGVYEQFANTAEDMLSSGDDIRNLTIDDEVIEA